MSKRTPKTKSRSATRHPKRSRDRVISTAPRSAGREKHPNGSQVSQVVGQFREANEVLRRLAEYFGTYVVLPPRLIMVTAVWVMAAYACELWDRFPHLAITSPEKRCGKTRFMTLIEGVTPNAYNTTSISPAAVYRLVDSKQPTLLLDEAQSLARRSSEASEVMREILNAGIDRDAKVIRCGGRKMTDLREFRVYSPKVIALIGQLDSVLADRCLPIEMKRKTSADSVANYRSRVVKPKAAEIREQLESWFAEHRQKLANVYDEIDPFPIDNDRMAELLVPLQAVLIVAGECLLPELEAYAFALEEAEAASSNQTPGAMLLRACREILGESKPFIATSDLRKDLGERSEEPWSRFSRGKLITAEQLASLLRPYGIAPDRCQKKFKGKVRTTRGYFRKSFADAWERYLVSNASS